MELISEQEKQEMIAAMITELGEEGFADLQEKAYCYRILTSMYYLDTVDPAEITQDIYDSYEGNVPAESIATIVAMCYPVVMFEYDTFDDEGNMNEEAIQVAIAHNEYLNLGKTKEHREFTGLLTPAEAKPAFDKHLH